MNCFKCFTRKEKKFKLPENKSSFISINNEELQLELLNEVIEPQSHIKEYQLEFKFCNVKYFLNQNIFEIRIRNKAFEDEMFSRHISSIVDSIESTLGLSLSTRFKSKSLNELNQLIKWQRTQALAEQLKDSKENEFVLDDLGAPPLKPKDAYENNLKYFSAYDIHQGWMGNCFHVGALMAFTKNEKLLQILIPIDNLDKENIQIGVYHFRFWKLGYWYDVVVDDFLPTNASNNELIFSYNKLFPNEFWVPLFEKAFAKFLGNYEELEKGVFENIALYLSGGLHEQYILNEIVNESSEKLPNKNELFEIIKIALNRKDLIGCICENEDIASKFGILKENVYLISSLSELNDKTKLVKLHNPFNLADATKTSNEYKEIEKKLKEISLESTTQPGEIWCDISNHYDYNKFKVIIKGKQEVDIVISFIQDWLRTNQKQPVQINIFRFDKEIEDWILHKNDYYDLSLQWCLRISMKPGQYLIIFESGLELDNDLKYCFRIFTDDDEINQLDVNEFDQEPRFDPIIA